MKVLIVSGIWPPDVGGPASHAPELAAFLSARGHEVEVVTTADRPPPHERYPVRYVSRRLPPGIRHLAVVALVARRARRNDVVYATSMLARAALAALVARKALVVKVTSDAAFERARRGGLVTGDVSAFQHLEGGARLRLYRALRDLSVRRAHAVVFPSDFLARIAVGWGVDPRRVTVLPNPVSPFAALSAGERRVVRSRLGFTSPTVVTAGRLTAAKALEVALAALAALEGAVLVIAGDGPERPMLEQEARRLGVAERVRFTGVLTREGVTELFSAADVAVLSSRWENFPHTVVEALAVGTPVVATRVGGVPEVVVDGENGLLVEPEDASQLAAALRRVLDDAALRARLSAAGPASVAALSPDAVYGRLERLLEDAT